MVALVCVGLYLAEERSTAAVAGLPLDDGWIHLQFARNLAGGDGLSYRPGTPVPGSTAPLWTAILALAFSLPGPLLLWVKLFGGVLYLGGAAVTFALARVLDVRPGAAGFAALLFLLTDAMVWSALSGMEIGLFVVLSVGGTAAHLRERRSGMAARPSLALVLLGLASLARPEGLLLLVLALADRLLLPAPGARRRESARGVAVGAACALAVVLPAVVFALYTSGSPLPTTYSVKTDGVRSLLPSGLYLLRVLGVLFRSHPLPVLLAAAGAVRLLERLGTKQDRGLLPALWTAALPLAYSLHDSPDAPMMVGNFGRYYFPLFPFVLVLAAVGLDQVLDRLALADRAWRAAAILLAAVLLVPPVTSLARGSERYALNVSNVNHSDVAMALWIREHVRPDALVAAQDVGAVGFFTPNPLLDLTGIVTPEILPSLEGAAGAPGGRAGLERFLAERRPEYLMLFADSYPGLLESTAAEVLHRIGLERNVTMAGADLVLARPRWDGAGAKSSR